MTRLLVSVRNAEEAVLALRGGAALIDVKEPTAGSLGRANDQVVSEVLTLVAGKVPVSAALGEWRDWGGQLLHPLTQGGSLLHPLTQGGSPGIAFLKWGLAGAAADWADRLRDVRQQIESNTATRIVYVAYADWQRAAAPCPGEVVRRAVLDRAAVLLVDTWCKDGTCLLDWLSVAELADLIAPCRTAGVRLALAGSLGPTEICRLQPLQPDWFAVRGAVCDRRERGGLLLLERVEQLAQLTASAG